MSVPIYSNLWKCFLSTRWINGIVIWDGSIVCWCFHIIYRKLKYFSFWRRVVKTKLGNREYLSILEQCCSESIRYLAISIAASYVYDFPANICLLKVNNRNTGKKCEICSKLTIETPERRAWRRCGIFIVDFEHISCLFPVSLLLLWTSKC